ncbi:unnamed protein product [Mytilus coruscus]|uniref:Uncharacterized protein n=1 Tax=Mytilus coruscus TaxID=42192 RepID=A0A6J8ASR3_MYTCO|nr:unnamed protein product [Mytilus coruscus]
MCIISTGVTVVMCIAIGARADLQTKLEIDKYIRQDYERNKHFCKSNVNKNINTITVAYNNHSDKLLRQMYDVQENGWNKQSEPPETKSDKYISQQMDGTNSQNHQKQINFQTDGWNKNQKQKSDKYISQQMDGTNSQNHQKQKSENISKQMDGTNSQNHQKQKSDGWNKQSEPPETKSDKYISQQMDGTNSQNHQKQKAISTFPNRWMEQTVRTTRNKKAISTFPNRWMEWKQKTISHFQTDGWNKQSEPPETKSDKYISQQMDGTNSQNHQKQKAISTFPNRWMEQTVDKQTDGWNKPEPPETKK